MTSAASDPCVEFALGDEQGFQGFLEGSPDCLVLMSGLRCPYSARFKPAFTRVARDLETPTAIRAVEHGGEGPVGEKLGVAVTPTVARFRNGTEAARLEALVLRGLSERRLRAWLKEQALL